MRRRLRMLPGLIGLLTAPLVAWTMIRAAVLGRRRGGVLRRGTLYPYEALREDMRLKVF